MAERKRIRDLDPREVAYWREFKRRVPWYDVNKVLRTLQGSESLPRQAVADVLDPFAFDPYDDFGDFELPTEIDEKLDKVPAGREKNIGRTSPQKLRKMFLARLAQLRMDAIDPTGPAERFLSNKPSPYGLEFGRLQGKGSLREKARERDLFLEKRGELAKGDIKLSAAAIRPNVTHTVRTPASYQSVAKSGELLDRATMDERGIPYTPEPQFDMPEEKLDKVFVATDPRDAALLDKDLIPPQQVVLRRSKLKFDPAGRRDSLQIKGPVDIKKAGGMLVMPQEPYPGGPSATETLYLDAPQGEPTRLIMSPYNQRGGDDSPKERLANIMSWENARNRLRNGEDRWRGTAGDMDWVDATGDARAAFDYSGKAPDVVGLSPPKGFFDKPTEFEPFVDPTPIKAEAAKKGIHSADIGKWEPLRQTAEDSSYVKALRATLKKKAPHLLGVAGTALALPAAARAAEDVGRIAEGDTEYRLPSMGDVAGMMTDAPLPAALGAGAIMGGVDAASRREASMFPQPESVEPTPMMSAGQEFGRMDGLQPLRSEDPYELAPVRQDWWENPRAKMLREARLRRR